MKISVVIVSWNAKEFLLQCLHSLARTMPRGSQSEVIVVDNASSDGSPGAVREAFPWVRLIQNDDNYGFAKANNIGIKASTGEYLFLINSDVVVKDGCFDRMLSHMAGHPDAGVTGPRILSPQGSVQRSCMGFPTLWNTFCRALALDSFFPGSRIFGGQLMTYWRHDEVRAVDVINGCFWMVRREALEEVGLLDEGFFIYGEDIDWCRRFNDAGWKVVFFPDAEAVHYGGASSANAPLRFYIEMQRANYQYWKKHRSRAASTAYLFICLLHHSLRLAGEAVLYPFRLKKRTEGYYKISRALASIKWSLTMLAAGSDGRQGPGGRIAPSVS